MDEAAVVLEEEGEGNVVYEDDGAYGNNEVSAENPSKRDGVFCCQKCGEAFREEAAYLNHLQLHSQGDNSMCLENVLNDKFEDETHHDRALLDVDSRLDADGQFTSEDSAVVKDSVAKPQSFQCEECGKSYGVMGHLLNHKRSHKQASKSVFHDLEHLKKKSFQCEFCGRSYSRATALDAHRRCHEEKLVKRSRSTAESLSNEQKGGDIKSIENHNEEEEKTDRDKKSVCSCGKSFATLVRLKTHQRFSRNSLCSPEEMFEKQKKSGDFQCSQCDKTFSGQIALINHERWHTHDVAENKFPCEECGKVFMTLTFYYRHQRLAHSKETPSKSFLHQVCQLQKKSFECKDCGLKFSRASALHSHELQHTDVFKETEKETDSAALLPQQNHEKNIKCENKVAESTEVFENLFSTTVGNHYVKDTEDDVEIFEPGDLIVKVISSSDSEDDSKLDRNSDLELLCESDHDIKEDGDIAMHHKVVSKPDLDLKIVQVDYGEHMPTVVEREWDNLPKEERFDCPDCYRWFTNPSSLRVHRMWHGVRKRRQLAQVRSQKSYKSRPHGYVLDKEEEDSMQPATELDEGEIRGVDTGSSTSESDTTASSQMNKLDLAKPEMDKFQKVYGCNICGKVYTFRMSYKRHLQMHEQEKGEENKHKGQQLRRSGSKKHECPDCGWAFFRQTRLISHLKQHKARKCLNHKCDKCNKTFASATSWLGHMRLHEQRPFWCYSCAKGFSDQRQFSKHMYLHKCKQHVCDICQKSFLFMRHLNDHYNSHTGAKPYICAYCGKGFSHPGTLQAHRKVHRRVKFGSSTSKDGLRSVMKRKVLERRLLPHINSQAKPMETKLQWPSMAREKKTTPQNKSDEQSKKFDYYDNGKPEGKHWEWQCCECELGFDEVTQLHIHYIQHATGEIPMGWVR